MSLRASRKNMNLPKKNIKDNDTSNSEILLTPSTINSLKEIIIPKVRETEAKQLIDYYNNHYEKKKNEFIQIEITKPKNDTLEPESILDYSFVTGKDINYKNEISKNKTKRRRHSEFIERQNNHNLKKEKKINKIKETLEAKKKKIMQDKPTINKNNNYISTKPPIYKRVSQILRDLNNKKEKLKEEIESEKYKDIISVNTKKTKISKEEAEQWYEYNQTWNKIREVRLNYIKNELEKENQLKEEYLNEETFHPKINKKSEMIFYEKQYQNVSDRLYQDSFQRKKKMQLKREQSMPSFQPIINKNYKISQSYYDYLNENQEKIYSINNFH